MGPDRNCSGGRLLSSNNVRQNRRPTLLSSHISRGLISRLRLHHDRHRGRVQPCLDAFCNLRLSPNCQELGRDNPDRLLHQSTCCLSSQRRLEHRHGFWDPANTPPNDKESPHARPTKTSPRRCLHRRFAVRRFHVVDPISAALWLILTVQDMHREHHPNFNPCPHPPQSRPNLGHRRPRQLDVRTHFTNLSNTSILQF